MLLGFRCKNFRSFRDEQSLSMLAGPTKNLSDQVIEVEGFEILKSALVLSANGAGKYNFFKAIRFSSQLIIKNEPVYGPHDTFQTLVGYEDAPSMFEYEIEIKGRFFRYGFEMILKDRKVVGEWLKEFSTGTSENTIFLRNELGIVTFDKEEKPFENINGDLFIHNARRKDFWYGKNQDHMDIYEVQKWFWESLAVIGPDASLLWDVDFLDKKNVDGITDVVSRFDTGITGSGFRTYNLGDEPLDIVKNSRVSEKDCIKRGSHGIFKQGEDGKIEAFRFRHGDEHDFWVNLDEESDGTLRIMKLSPILFRDDKDCTYIIDEFDRTLHPSVVYGFVKWFLRKHYSSHKQFIMTTHNTLLLDQDLIRRDEVWFVQKDGEGSSSLYSLDDYKVRFDKKLEKAYLEGHFRALPDIVLPEDIDDAF